jgi:hypothetical protein
LLVLEPLLQRDHIDRFPPVVHQHQRRSELAITSSQFLEGIDHRLGDFSPGRWFWLLEKPKAFANPTPARGYQRIWTYSGAIIPTSV